MNNIKPNLNNAIGINLHDHLTQSQKRWIRVDCPLVFTAHELCSKQTSGSFAGNRWCIYGIICQRTLWMMKVDKGSSSDWTRSQQRNAPRLLTMQKPHLAQGVPDLRKVESSKSIRGMYLPGLSFPYSSQGTCLWWQSKTGCWARWTLV